MSGERDDTNGYSDNSRHRNNNGGAPEESLPRLTAGETKFPGRESLYRSYSTIPRDQFEQLCIAEMEGDLSPAQANEIEAAIESSESLRQIHTIIQKTKLTPPAITFAGKRSLKKAAINRRIITAGISAAAAVSITVVVIAFLLTAPPQSIPVISEETEPAVRKIPGISLETPSPQLPLIAAIPDLITIEELVASLPEIPEETATEISRPLLTHAEKAIPATFTLSAPLQMQMVYISYRDTDYDYYGTATLRDNILIAFREKVLGRERPAAGPVSGYELAAAGVAGINQLLGWEMSVNIETSGKGEINSLAFSSKLITINRSYEIIEDTR